MTATNGDSARKLCWWTAREWFGKSAGVAAAVLCALSDYHAAFSRTSLTDVFMGFWFLLAVYLAWLALVENRKLIALAAGAATGIAWCTKYNWR